jgi:hypothetical protein
MSNLPLFDRPIPVYDPEPSFLRSEDKVVAPRLNRQCQTILARLQRGTMTTGELSAIACQYNARIYELRKAGYRVECIEQDRVTGLSVYELKVSL